MIIKSKLTEKDYINANFVLLYSKTSIKIFTCIIGFCLVVSVLGIMFLPKYSYNQILTPIIMLSAMPVLTYFTARKNYTANQRISETIEYEFDKDNLIIKGESFSSQLSWDKIYKVTQNKNWILIWQSKQIANLIPKRDVWDEQVDTLKSILKEHRIKNNLL